MKKTRPPAIHPGVVQIKDGEARRWTGAILSPEPGPGGIAPQVRQLVEASLLARLSQPPEAEVEGLDCFDLALFTELGDGEEEGLVALGFESVALESLSAEHEERLTVFRSEVRKAGQGELGELLGLRRLGVVSPKGALHDEVQRACRAAEAELRGTVWGQEPGRFSKALVDNLRGRVQVEIGPDPAGLDLLEDLVVERCDGEIYPMEPLVFQALCDFLCVVAQASQGLEVQWGMCAVDPRTGLSPAPIARIRDRRGPWHTLAVGADVIAVIVPWAAGGEPGRSLAGILARWVEACVP